MDEYTVKAERNCENPEFTIEHYVHLDPSGITFHPRLEIRGSEGELLEIKSSIGTDINTFTVKLRRRFNQDDYYTIRLSYVIPVKWWLIKKIRTGEKKDVDQVSYGSKYPLSIRMRKLWKIGPTVLEIEDVRLFRRRTSVYPYVEVPRGYDVYGVAVIKSEGEAKKLAIIPFEPIFGRRFIVEKDQWLHLSFVIRPRKDYLLQLILLSAVVILLYALPHLWPLVLQLLSFNAPYKPIISIAPIPVILAILRNFESWPYERWIHIVQYLALFHILYAVVLASLHGMPIV